MQTDSDSSSNFAHTSQDLQKQRLLIPRSQRRKFLLHFTLFTFIGWIVGGIASIALEKSLLETLPSDVSQQLQSRYILAAHFSSSVLFAAIFGADQALVLRRYISGWLWMLATSTGWLIANSVSGGWINYISAVALSFNQTLSPQEIAILGFLSTISYILSGIWLGLSQWLILLRYTTGAWWWSFLPSISFFFISILVWMLSLVQQFLPEANRTRILYWSGQGLTAIILGVIPAIGLCHLKKNSRRNRRLSNSS